MRCADSGQRTNLWLNLTDGYVGSGRAQVGIPGTGAALAHFDAEKAAGRECPLVVKIGTVTVRNGAATGEIYSYAEDCAALDSQLEAHLAHFGLNGRALLITDKTTSEAGELSFMYRYISRESC